MTFKFVHSLPIPMRTDEKQSTASYVVRPPVPLSPHKITFLSGPQNNPLAVR